MAPPSLWTWPSACTEMSCWWDLLVLASDKKGNYRLATDGHGRAGAITMYMCWGQQGRWKRVGSPALRRVVKPWEQWDSALPSSVPPGPALAALRVRGCPRRRQHAAGPHMPPMPVPPRHTTVPRLQCSGAVPCCAVLRCCAALCCAVLAPGVRDEWGAAHSRPRLPRARGGARRQRLPQRQVGESGEGGAPPGQQEGGLCRVSLYPSLRWGAAAAAAGAGSGLLGWEGRKDQPACEASQSAGRSRAAVLPRGLPSADSY